jgi:hypothetical protein
MLRIRIRKNYSYPDLVDNGSRPLCKCCGFGSGKKDADLNLVDTGSRPLSKCRGFGSGKKDADPNLVDYGSRPLCKCCGFWSGKMMQIPFFDICIVLSFTVSVGSTDSCVLFGLLSLLFIATFDPSWIQMVCWMKFMISYANCCFLL